MPWFLDYHVCARHVRVGWSTGPLCQAWTGAAPGRVRVAHVDNFVDAGLPAERHAAALAPCTRTHSVASPHRAHHQASWLREDRIGPGLCQTVGHHRSELAHIFA